MRSLLTVALVAATSVPAHAQPARPKTFVMTTGTVACRLRTDYMRLYRINDDGDHDTFIREAAIAYKNGECILLESGEAVFLDGMVAPNDLNCIRREGDGHCWWTDGRYVKPSKS